MAWINDLLAITWDRLQGNLPNGLVIVAASFFGRSVGDYLGGSDFQNGCVLIGEVNHLNPGCNINALYMAFNSELFVVLRENSVFSLIWGKEAITTL